jgi:hypothetical protein
MTVQTVQHPAKVRYDRERRKGWQFSLRLDPEFLDTVDRKRHPGEPRATCVKRLLREYIGLLDTWNDDLEKRL